MLSRIKQYIDFKGISIATFERSIGMSNASFGKSLKSGGTIGSDKIEKILNTYTDLNLEWLITGKGQMIKKQPDNNNVSPSPAICQKCLEKDERIKELKEIIETQRKLINYLECERPDCETGQKRKAG